MDNMSLSESDLSAIGEYVQSNMGKWLAGQGLVVSNVAAPSQAAQNNFYLLAQINEREIRNEEELKHLRELTLKGFEQMDKRFELVDKRFEQVDKRFELMDQRFDTMNRRFQQFMIWSFGVTVSAGGVVITVLK